MGDQKTVTVARELRPLRLSFLIRPGDKAAFRRALQINTILWAGHHNSIIPVYKKKPVQWKEKFFSGPKAQQIIAGYLDAFEPDFIVAMNKGLTDKLQFPERRVLSPIDVLNGSDQRHIGYGIGLFEVLKDLYKREFQFHRRHPVKAYLPIAADKNFAALVATCFGEFPHEASLRYFRKAYEDVFEAEEVKVDSSNILKLLAPDKLNPLRVGMRNIDIRQRGYTDPAIFYMDAFSTLDLLDFWNLRAIGWRVLPLPRQWEADLIEDCSKFIKQNYRSNPYNKNIKYGTTLLCSRSSSFELMQKFGKLLQTPGSHSLSFQHWYPRIWDEWARDKDHVGRCDLIAKEDQVEVGVTDERIRFSGLDPEFIERFGGREARWANVVQIRDHSHAGDTASVIPPGLPELRRALGAFSDHVWGTREGIVIACEHTGWTYSFRLPNATEIFRNWMKAMGFELNISGAGNIAAQVIRKLGGQFGIGILRNEETLHLLNKMAHGTVEEEVKDEEGSSKTIRVQTIHKDRWIAHLTKINHNDREVAARQLSAMLSREMLKIGLRLQCPKCRQHTWFDLNSLADTVSCERCLQEFSFPAASPPTDWRYRAIGPFSVENYAAGSYCVALVLGSLGHNIHSEITWVPSFDLKGKDGKKLEADFGLFWQRSTFEKSDPVLILGECKSYNKFELKDIRRMEALGKAFPGAVLAFCSLRKHLSATEKKLIARVVRKGRGYLKAGRLHNPVLVLTGVELFSEIGPPHCWKAAGEPFSKFENVYIDDVQTLCDATQQMHLNIESYWTWREGRQRRRERLRAMRQRKPPQLAPDSV
jgi:hypothetical protein